MADFELRETDESFRILAEAITDIERRFNWLCIAVVLLGIGLLCASVLNLARLL